MPTETEKDFVKGDCELRPNLNDVATRSRKNLRWTLNNPKDKSGDRSAPAEPRPPANKRQHEAATKQDQGICENNSAAILVD
jgi:hypothetical protein